MRVLWVTPQRPDRGGGGGSHHEFELLSGLSARHDIEVLTTYLAASPLDGIPLDVIGGWRPGVGPTNKRERLRMEIGSRGPAFGWPLRHRMPPLAAEVARRDADLVHVMLGELAPVLESTELPTSLLLFDSYTRHARAMLRVEHNARRRVLARLELERCKRFERRWYPLADGIACVSAEDASAVSSLVGRHVDVLPNPIADDLFAEPTTPRSSSTVLFVGSLGYPPNVDAIEWLVRDIWPGIEAMRPDARLIVAGRANDDPAVVAHLRSLLGDRLRLDVPDIRTVYWEAAVTIAPIRLGGGLKNKVIHAMACGTPVVCTSAAAEGTGAVDGESAVIADSASALAAAVVNVLEDPRSARQRAARAAQIVRSLTTERVVDLVDQWWHRALEHHAMVST